MRKRHPTQILTKKMPKQNIHLQRVNCVRTSVCAMEMTVRSGMSLKAELTSALSLCLVTLCLLTTSITSVYDAFSGLTTSGPQ